MAASCGGDPGRAICAGLRQWGRADRHGVGDLGQGIWDMTKGPNFYVGVCMFYVLVLA